MHPVHVTRETAADGVLERDFTVAGVPGVLWSPENGSAGAPLVLMGHGGGQHKRVARQLARARELVTGKGFRVVALDAPGHGERPREAADERAQSGIQRAVRGGDSASYRTISLEYGDLLAERAVPEWRAALDALLALPEFGADVRIGYGGGVTLGTAIGVPLVAVEPRISVAAFGNGFFVGETVLAAARKITVPVEFLMQWDDPHVSREEGFALFDAFATTDKTLHANLGGHGRIPWYEDNAFFIRHLSPSTD